MCVRVLNWIGAHPDVEPGFVVLVAQLEALVARMTQVISEQRTGLVDSRAASERTFELRRAMRSLAIAHLAEIGGLAARELHELAGIFRFKPTARTYVAFQSAAQSMFDHAQEHKEVLVKYGLSESWYWHSSARSSRSSSRRRRSAGKAARFTPRRRGSWMR